MLESRLWSCGNTSGSYQRRAGREVGPTSRPARMVPQSSSDVKKNQHGDGRPSARSRKAKHTPFAWQRLPVTLRQERPGQTIAKEAANAGNVIGEPPEKAVRFFDNVTDSRRPPRCEFQSVVARLEGATGLAVQLVGEGDCEPASGPDAGAERGLDSWESAEARRGSRTSLLIRDPHYAHPCRIRRASSIVALSKTIAWIAFKTVAG